MTRSLVYYCHRLTDPDPKVQAANLSRAIERLRYLRPQLAARGEVLWAPWIALADAGVVADAAVWGFLGDAISLSKAILLDLDGAPESGGMLREAALAEERGIEVRRTR